MTRERDATLDALAMGYWCTRSTCKAGPDEPCVTPWGKPTLPHAARINRAVRLYRKWHMNGATS